MNALVHPLAGTPPFKSACLPLDSSGKSRGTVRILQGLVARLQQMQAGAVVLLELQAVPQLMSAGSTHPRERPLTVAQLT